LLSKAKPGTISGEELDARRVVAVFAIPSYQSSGHVYEVRWMQTGRF
jgi:hypothetical protein